MSERASIRFVFSLLSLLAVLVVSGCAIMAPGTGHGLRVIGESNYCGTSSQQSAAHYFADEAEYEQWRAQRDIDRLARSNWPANGIAVVEMGQRPTGGYQIEIDRGASSLEGDVLVIVASWNAPRLDAAVSQALIAPCKVVALPAGDYERIRLVDQLGQVRGQATVDRRRKQD